MLDFTFSFFCLLLVAFIAFTIMTMYCFIRVIQIEEEQDFHDGKSLRNIRKQYQQQQRRMKNNITSNGSNSAKNNQSALIPMIENKLDSAASSSSNNASTGTIVVNVNETIAEYNVPSSQEQNVGQEKPISTS